MARETFSSGNYWEKYRRGRVKRRQLLRGSALGATGLAGMALVGCGDDDDDGEATSQPTSGGNGGAQPTTATGSSPTAEAPRGQLNIAWHDPGVLQFWNPAFYISGWQVVYREAMADSLIGFQPDGDKFKFVPKIAESWERSPDGLSVTFKLNPNATFSDGSPITSEDVKFSYETIGTEGWRHARKAEWAAALKSVDTPDPTTAVVQLNTPYPILTTYNYQFPIISKKAFDAAGGMEGFEDKPVASGPFKLVSGQKAERAMLTAVDPHWRHTAGFKDMQITVVKEEATRIAQLQTGELDMAGITAPFKKQVEDIDGARVLRMGDVPHYLVMMDPRVGTDSPTKDPRVREALSLAINRQDIVDGLLEGEAKLQGSFSTSVIDGFVDIPADPYDLTKAKSLLEAAGYGDGFTIDLFSTSPVQEFMNVMVADWKQIGVDAQIKVQDGAAATDRTYGKKTPGMYVQLNGFDYTDGAMWGLFVYSDGGLSYHNLPDLDETMRKVTYGVDDEERAQAWGDVQRRVHDERIMTVLWSANTLRGVGKKVKAWEPVPGIGWFVNLEYAIPS